MSNRAIDINWKKRKIGDEVWSFSTHYMTISKYKLVDAEYDDHQIIMKLMPINEAGYRLSEEREENNVYGSYEEARIAFLNYMEREIESHKSRITYLTNKIKEFQ